MNRKERNKAKKILRRNLVAGTLLLFLLGLSIAGATGAWFTDSSLTLRNIFTAGTVLIEVNDFPTNKYDGNGTINNQTNEIVPGGYLQKHYTVKNDGSKSIYIRAYFEGYWDTVKHQNRATVTAVSATVDGSSGITVEDSDTAYFYYQRPSAPDPYTGYGTTTGFTDKDYSLDPTNILFGSQVEYENDNTDSDNGNDNGNSDECVIVTPIEANEPGDYAHYFNDSLSNSDPIPPSLPFPEDSNVRYYFKIERDQDQVDDDGEEFNSANATVYKYILSDNGTWSGPIATTTTFKVTIKKNADNSFDFLTDDFPVYHAYVKGGSGNNGNLYPYYHPESDPAYPDGVTKGCNLIQPGGGGWSHIVFYFSDPKPDPSIKIIKEVSFDGGGNWGVYNQSPGYMLSDSSTIPLLRFRVENTGNVNLTDVVITDDVLDLSSLSYNISYPFEPGHSFVTDIIVYDIWPSLLSTDTVIIELCEDAISGHDHSSINYNAEDWVPKGAKKLPVYFYNKNILHDNDSAGLCVKVSIDPEYKDDYRGSTLIINSYFEAVQASNNMIWHNWKDDLVNLGYSEGYGWWVN